MDRWKFLFLLYCGLILYVSSLAPKELPDGPSVVSDKVLHLLEYGLWGILCWGAFVKRRGLFPWGLVVLGAWSEFLTSVGRIGWAESAPRTSGMPPQMRSGAFWALRSPNCFGPSAEMLELRARKPFRPWR